jgi:hypothetical protein
MNNNLISSPNARELVLPQSSLASGDDGSSLGWQETIKEEHTWLKGDIQPNWQL